MSRAISALRLSPVMFELGARPYPPREVYQQYLAQSDVFIGLYWQRYGQLVPGAQVSGLHEEFELSGALPRLPSPRPLPAGTTSLLGRERDIEEVAALVERPGVRLVTLTGPGGVGKTRLAVAAAERLRGRFGAGIVFVLLDSVTDPAQVAAAIADLVTQVRQRLGAARFDQAFAAGSGLSQQQAAAIVQDQRGTAPPAP